MTNKRTNKHTPEHTNKLLSSGRLFNSFSSGRQAIRTLPQANATEVQARRGITRPAVVQ